MLSSFEPVRYACISDGHCPYFVIRCPNNWVTGCLQMTNKDLPLHEVLTVNLYLKKPIVVLCVFSYYTNRPNRVFRLTVQLWHFADWKSESVKFHKCKCYYRSINYWYIKVLWKCSYSGSLMLKYLLTW